MKPSIAIRALVPHVVPDDTIRFVHDEGVLVVALAIGSEGEFSAYSSARFDRTQADIDESGPTGQLFAVAVTRTAVHAAWQSGAFAFLARDGVALDPTVPHSLREDYARNDPDFSPELLAQLPEVWTRTIGSVEPPSTASFLPRPGDVLVIVSRSSAASPTELARALARVEPVSAAEHLADLAFANDTPVHGSVVLVPL